MASRPEPEWDETEQAWMLGLAEYRQTEQCPVCGRPKWMCQSEDAEALYEPGAPVRCYATTATLRGQKEYLDGAHAPFEQALSWPVKIRQPEGSSG